MHRSLLLLALLGAGCRAAITPVVSSTTPKPSPTVARATPTPPPTVAPAPTRRACLTAPGRVEITEYLDHDLPRSIPYRVFLPPCLDDRGGQPLPVLILLHGLQLTDSQWDDLGVDETAEDLIRSAEIPPLVIVMPWQRRGLDFEGAIVEKLLPHVRSTYAGPGDSSLTAIGGISRGAGWALRIGLNHPGEFGAIGLHSPAVLVPDLYFVPEWVGAAGDEVPAIWIDIASRDTSKASATELAAALDDLGVEYAWSTAPGEHSASYWSSRMSDYLRWYASRWGKSPSGASAP